MIAALHLFPLIIDYIPFQPSNGFCVGGKARLSSPGLVRLKQEKAACDYKNTKFLPLLVQEMIRSHKEHVEGMASNKGLSAFVERLRATKSLLEVA